MGATPFQIFREIIFPLSLPGIAIGMIFVFVMVMGEFATAVVVYGGKTSTTGTVILNYYAIANYPFAAVNAFMLMLAMMIGVIIILRLVDIRKELVVDGAFDAGTPPQDPHQGGLQRLLRDLSDLRLRADVRDVHAVLPGTARRRDLPDARFQRFLVGEAGRAVGGRRHQELAGALADPRGHRHGDHGDLLDHAGDGVPQEVSRLGGAVLRSDVGPDGAGRAAQPRFGVLAAR